MVFAGQCVLRLRAGLWIPVLVMLVHCGATGPILPLHLGSSPDNQVMKPAFWEEVRRGSHHDTLSGWRHGPLQKQGQVYTHQVRSSDSCDLSCPGGSVLYKGDRVPALPSGNESLAREWSTRRGGLPGAAGALRARRAQEGSGESRRGPQTVCSKCCQPVHITPQYLLSTYFVPGTVFGLGMNGAQDRGGPCPGLPGWWGKRQGPR